MLKFLFCGIGIIAGIVLLFVASFGDVGQLSQRLYSGIAMQFEAGHPAPAQEAAAHTAADIKIATSDPSDQAAVQQQLQELQKEAEQALHDSQKQPADSAIHASLNPHPAIEPAVAPAPAVPAQPVTPQATAAAAAAQPAAADAAALRHQREVLESQLQKLRAEMAATSQTVAALHDKADTERRAIDSLQQQRAAEKAAVEQMQAKAQQAAEQAKAQQAAEQAKAQQAAEQAKAQQAADQAKAQQEAEQAKEAAVAVAAARGSSAQADLNADASATQGGTTVPRTPTRSAQNSEPARMGTVEAILDRLRHQTNRRRSSAAKRAQPKNTVETASAAPPPPLRAVSSQPPPIDVQQRLGMARAALIGGHPGEAQQLLEEAQLQLVFRPISPDGDGPPAQSRTAGEVAEALNMLGAGDAYGALQYLDQAIAEVRMSDYEAHAAPFGDGNMAPADPSR